VRLTYRVGKLEDRLPERVRRRAVPTGSLAAFARGELSGAFTPADIDLTDPAHIELGTLFVTLLVTLTPEHRAWCAANPWARSPEEEWERLAPGLLPL
jgi:hypothetical protein